MKVLIEKYRGFEIFFDTDTEKFTFQEEDKTIIKPSYASLKKAVDEYIKENSTFVPFEMIYNPLEHKPMSYPDRITITGIRKDGRFIYTDKKHEQHQITQYNERNWIQDIKENEQHILKIALLEGEIDRLYKEISNVKQKIKIVSLEDIKDKYLKV